MQHYKNKVLQTIESARRNLSVTLLFLVCFIMLFLGDGKQSYVDVVAYGGVIALSLLTYYGKRSLGTITKKEAVLWACVLLYISVGSVFSGSLSYSLFFVLKLILAFTIYTIFSTQKLSVSFFGSALIGFSCASMVLSAIMYLFPFSSHWLPPMNLLYRVYGHNAISYVLLAALPFVLKLIYKHVSLGSLLLCLLFFLGIGASLSRSVWLIVSAYMLFVMLTIKTTNRKKRCDNIRFSAMPVLFCLFVLTVFFMNRHLFIGELTQKGTFFEARGKYWMQAAEGFFHSPLFGTGPGTFYLQSIKYHTGPSSTSWYAHNYPLQLLSEVGVLGMLLFFFLGRDIINRMPLLSANNYEYKELIESILLTLLLSIFTINLDYLILWVLTWAAIGILVGQFRQPQNTSPILQKITMGSGVLILVVVYTCHMGIELYQLVLGKKQIVFQPHNIEKTIEYLEENSGNITYAKANTILFFNKEHPEVLSALGKSFEQVDEQFAASLYRHALKNDPRNQSNFTNFTGLLSKHRELITTINLFDIQDAFYQSSQSWNPGTVTRNIFTDIPKEKTYRETFNKALEQSLEKNKIIFPKLYYLWGMDLAKINPQISKKLLETSVALAPQWSYFYLELAALSLHSGEKTHAKEILHTCEKQKFAGEHCSTYTVDTLPPLGYFKKLIIEEL